MAVEREYWSRPCAVLQDLQSVHAEQEGKLTVSSIAPTSVNNLFPMKADPTGEYIRYFVPELAAVRGDGA